MPKEFEKFGKYKKIAKELVDKDDIVLTNKLYSNLNKYSTRVFISYNPDFWNCYEIIKNMNTPSLFVTRMMLYNQDIKKNDGYHAVALLKQGKQFYMFDPNGYTSSKDHTYIYTDHNNKPLDGKAFSNKYKINLPKYQGIQSISPGGEKIPKGYINDGGYCMFYLYIGLKNVLNIYEKSKKSIVTICKNITDVKLESKLLEYFPKDIHLKTHEILKNIF